MTGQIISLRDHPLFEKAKFIRLLDVLGFAPEDRTAVCHLPVGGSFVATVGTAKDAFARLAPHQKDADLWFGVNPLRSDACLAPGERGRAEHVDRLTCLFADLDAKPSGLASLDECRALVDRVSGLLGGCQPVAVISSGHGIQPLWKLDAYAPAEHARAVQYLRAFGALVRAEALAMGGDVDSVFEPARVLRVPQSYNRKDPDHPVHVGLSFFDDDPDALPDAITLDDLEGFLIAAGVRPDDFATEAPSTERVAFSAWTPGATTCGYARAMVKGWATDTPQARHPWLVSQAVRLHSALRLGCISAEDFASATDVLRERFAALCATTGVHRAVAPREVEAALAWGRTRTEERALEDVRADFQHDHHGAEKSLVNGMSTAGEGSISGVISWSPLDVTAAVDGLLSGTITAPRPTVGTFALAGSDEPGALFYSGRVNGIAGESGGGKTWTALVVAAQELNAGAPVVYVDFEDSLAGIVARLLALGVAPELVRAGFVYLHPDARLDDEAAEALTGTLDAAVPSLVVIDSTGEGLSIDGANPNADEQVAAWFRSVPRRIASHASAPCVLVLDHVTKDTETRGLWPIGSQRKRAAIDGAQYVQKTVQPFSKDRAGSAVLVCAKDRHGAYALGQKVAELQVSPGDGGAVSASLVPYVTPDMDAVFGFRPTVVMAAVSDYLATAVGEADRTMNAVCKAVTGKRTTVSRALSLLVEEGYVASSPGPRNSTIYTLKEPFSPGEPVAA